MRCAKIHILAALALLVCLPNAALSAPPSLDRYKGADGGWVVLSVVGSISAFTPIVVVNYERLDEPGRGEFSAVLDVPFAKADIKERVTPPPPPRSPLSERGLRYAALPSEGLVRMAWLPPGRYAIRRLRADVPSSYERISIQRWLEIPNLSLPFEVVSGRTTYIGEYRWWELEAGRLPFATFEGWAVIVSDQSVRDLAIARKRKPAIGEADARVPDVDGLGDPRVRSAP